MIRLVAGVFATLLPCADIAAAQQPRLRFDSATITRVPQSRTPPPLRSTSGGLFTRTSVTNIVLESYGIEQ